MLCTFAGSEPEKAMLTIIRTNSDHPDFKGLVQLLDRDLAISDGDDHAFYNQFNSIASIKHALVAYEEDVPVACGAIKSYDPQSMEVKRMFTHPDHRKKGIASAVLSELEQWAVELGISRCVLETGKNQPEAIAMYYRCGYQRIPNYGQYEGVVNSFCFEKMLR
jgi:GNAT superfamily N-acetyltransferase